MLKIGVRIKLGHAEHEVITYVHVLAGVFQHFLWSLVQGLPANTAEGLLPVISGEATMSASGLVCLDFPCLASATTPAQST